MRLRPLSAISCALTAALLSAACGDDTEVCPAPLATCGDTCVDLASDPANCGACGSACDDGLFCSAGACKDTCDEALTRCDDSCYDTAHDPRHCGGCGNECAAGEVCSMGTCGVACLGGTTQCGVICASLDVDPNNCGGCGVACGNGEVCEDGACVLGCGAGEQACGGVCIDVTADEENCGDCGTTCGAMQVCVTGACADSTPLVVMQSASYAGVTPRDLLLVDEYDYGTHVQLNATSFGTDTVTDYVVGPTGDVVFIGAQDTEGVFELYLLPAGGAAQVKLSQTLVTGGNVTDLVLSTDGGRVVYRADADTDGTFELYTVTLGNPGAAVKLNGALTTDGDVAGDYALSADGSRVAYRADQDTDGLMELYTTLVVTPASNAKVNAPIDPAGGIDGFAIDGDGTSFLYAYDDDTNVQLYAVESSALETATKVHPDITEGWVSQIAFTPDGTHAVYVADLDDGALRLYATALSALGTATRLNQTLESNEDVYDFLLPADSTRVVFRSQVNEGDVGLFVVDLASPGDAVELSDPSEPVSVGRYLLSGDDSALFFVSSGGGKGVAEIGGGGAQDALYHVDMANPGIQTKLNHPLESNAYVDDELAVAHDGSRVFYLATDATFSLHAYMVAVAEPGAAIDLSPPLRTFGSSVADVVIAESKAYYRGDYEVDERYDIYQVDVAGGPSMKVTPPLDPATEIDQLAVSPDGTKVAYRADAETPGQRELFFVDTTNLGVAIKLSGALTESGDVHDFQFAPDSSGVLYRADATTPEQDELYWVDFANPGVAVLVSGNVAGRPDADVSAYAMASDASFAVFTADTVYDDEPTLFIAALPTGTVTQLSTDVSTSSVADFVISHDDTFIVYRADETTDGQLELFAVDALTTSPTPSTPLSLPLANLSADVNGGYRLTADDTTVFYIGDADVAGQKELFYVDFVNDTAGQIGADPPAASASFDVYDFVLSSDDAHLVYRANHTDNGRNELWYVDLTNPTASTKVNSPAPNDANDLSNNYAILPSNDGVVYRGDLLASSRDEVFYTAFSELGVSTRVHPNLSSALDVFEMVVSPNGGILLRGEVFVNWTELYAADLSALGTASRISTPWPATDIVDIQRF